MGMKVRSMSSKKVERRAWGEGERWGVWVAKKKLEHRDWGEGESWGV